MFAIKLAFAGLGHLVAHWSLGLSIIALCLVVEFASGWLLGYLPILTKPITWVQKYVLFIAIGTALVLLGEYIGAIHTQVQKRPLVIENERINFDAVSATAEQAEAPFRAIVEAGLSLAHPENTEQRHPVSSSPVAAGDCVAH